MILVQSVALVELQLDLHLLVRQRFATDSAALPAPRSTEHAVRPSRRQLPTPDRCSGFLAEDGLVRHDNSPGLAEKSSPDARSPTPVCVTLEGPMEGDPSVPDPRMLRHAAAGHQGAAFVGLVRPLASSWPRAG